jgi:hypothetical protein
MGSQAWAMCFLIDVTVWSPPRHQSAPTSRAKSPMLSSRFSWWRSHVRKLCFGIQPKYHALAAIGL